MKMLSKLLTASFLVCVLSLGIFAQSEEDQLAKKNDECREKSDWNCVIETAEKLMKIKPNETHYMALRGEANFELNRFQEAEADFVKAYINSRSVDPLVQYFWGRLMIVKDDRKSAINFFKIAASDLNDPRHKIFQNTLDMTQDSTKTNQDLREKYSSYFCRSAYQVDKDSFAKDDNTVPMSFIKEKNLAGLKQVLPCRFDLNKENKKGATALIYASLLFTDPSYVNELIKNGADPNFATLGSGFTALMMTVAVEPDKPDIVRALLNAGASPLVKDKDGHDLLFYAKANKLTESAKLIQAALDKLPNGK